MRPKAQRAVSLGLFSFVFNLHYNKKEKLHDCFVNQNCFNDRNIRN